MTQLEMFKHNWKPNYSDSSYECFCFRTDLNKLVEEIRADERVKTIDEFYNRLFVHKTDINLANYPWNYVELVARKMTNELKEQK